MKIVIAGGTGFLGENLEQFFLNKNYEVKILTRNPKRKNEIFWDSKTVGTWKNELENGFQFRYPLFDNTLTQLI